MKEIIEILRGEFYGLFCGIFGCVIDSILMITLFGKKKYSYILPEMLGLRFVIYNVGLLLIANHFYGGQQWFRLMMPTIASASTFLIMFLTTFLWKEQLAKVLLGFCLCDFGGTAIVYGVPSLGFHPVVNAILSIIIFLIIYKIITPLLKKYQNYRIKHSYICSEILIVLILSGWLSNFLYVSIEDSVAAQDTMLHKMGIYFSTMVALSVTVVFFIYSIQLSRRKKQLIYATEQMESYYSKVTIQVNELQEFRQDVEEGFEEILKTKKAGSVKEKKQSVLAYRKALGDFKKAKETAADEEVRQKGASFYAKTCITLTDYQEAIKTLEAKGEYELADWMNLAFAYKCTGNWKKSKELLLQAVLYYPEDYRLYMRLCYLECELQDRKPQALKDYSQLKVYYDKAVSLLNGKTGNEEWIQLKSLIVQLKEYGWM